MCTPLRKCAAGDIVPSLKSVKEHGSELKFFVSIFGKLHQIKKIKSSKVATFENCEIFSNYYFSYVRDYKVTLAGGNYVWWKWINWIFSFRTHLQILHNHINDMILHNLMTQMDWIKRHVSGLFYYFLINSFAWLI